MILPPLEGLEDILSCSFVRQMDVDEQILKCLKDHEEKMNMLCQQLEQIKQQLGKTK